MQQAAFSYDAELQAAGLSVMGPARSSGGLDMAGMHSAQVTCSEVLSRWWERSKWKPKAQDCTTQESIKPFRSEMQALKSFPQDMTSLGGGSKNLFFQCLAKPAMRPGTRL